MFKRGGFASYTKTGRSIALGRSFGAAMARGSNRNSNDSSTSNSEEPSCFAMFLFLLICAALLQSITEALKQKQLQPQ